MMLAQSPMAPWLVLVVCIATLSALPTSHGNEQVDPAPSKYFGVRVPLNGRPFTNNYYCTQKSQRRSIPEYGVT